MKVYWETATQAVLGVALALTLWPRPVLAFGRGDIGTSGAQFLNLSPGARPAGMGGAFSGVADDIHAVYYNPAGLGFFDHVEAGAMHDSHFQGINYEFGALAVPMNSWVDTREAKNSRGVMAAAVYSLSVGGIERRGATESDAPTGTFSSNDFAYSLAYSLAPSPNYAVGAAFKFIDQNLDSSRACAAALDAGWLFKRDKLSLGAGFRNLGSRSKFAQAADPLPLALYLGGGYRLEESLLAAVDIRAPRDNSASFSLGAEYSRKFSADLSGFLRAGFNSAGRDADGLDGVSLGAGVRLNGLSFDFAWVPFGVLGDTFRYSLLARF